MRAAPPVQSIPVILLVEDDEDVREMLEHMLAGRGWAIEVANNGSAALTILERQRPCLMILDLVMPVMTGWEVLERMKAGRHADVPVCVISAFDGRTPPEAIASLCKPFDSSDLLALATRYCTHIAASSQSRRV